MVNKSDVVYLIQLLKKNKITYGVGGSLLLQALKLETKVNDLDIMIDVNDALLIDILLKDYVDQDQKPNDPKYDSLYFREFKFNQTAIDIMAGLKINYQRKWYGIPFDDKTPIYIIDNINYMLLEDWYVIYYLLDRKAKVKLIENYFFQTRSFSKIRINDLTLLDLPVDLKLRLIKLLNI